MVGTAGDSVIARLRSVLFPGTEQPRHARREPAPEWVHPYSEQQDARLSGEEYRRRYLDYTLDEAGHARAAGIDR